LNDLLVNMKIEGFSLSKTRFSEVKPDTDWNSAFSEQPKDRCTWLFMLIY
jgi:hypothetical protein